jgi:hypothetical protein
VPWIPLDVVGAWRERAAAYAGIVPDNGGPDGVVGSLLDGRWPGLPASIQIRLTFTLALRTRPPSHATPFDDLQGLQVSNHARLKSQFIRTDRSTRQPSL